MPEAVEPFLPGVTGPWARIGAVMGTGGPTRTSTRGSSSRVAAPDPQAPPGVGSAFRSREGGSDRCSRGRGGHLGEKGVDRIRRGAVTAPHSIPLAEQASAYLSSELFTARVVPGLTPLFKADPDIRVYTVA